MAAWKVSRLSPHSPRTSSMRASIFLGQATAAQSARKSLSGSAVPNSSSTTWSFCAVSTRARRASSSSGTLVMYSSSSDTSSMLRGRRFTAPKMRSNSAWSCPTAWRTRCATTCSRPAAISLCLSARNCPTVAAATTKKPRSTSWGMVASTDSAAALCSRTAALMSFTECSGAPSSPRASKEATCAPTSSATNSLNSSKRARYESSGPWVRARAAAMRASICGGTPSYLLTVTSTGVWLQKRFSMMAFSS
mmetsp:Transcript_19043/g.55995  ORF Transcript_19043/g.55995 Transcript_19043/m.55995 type:complete len:250 (+) Transcript_19043:3099-3848(+)